MKKTEVTVAVLDFDETLSGPFGALSVETAGRIRRLLEKHSLTPIIVSGRPMHFLAEKARLIGCSNYVGENGNAIRAGRGRDEYLEDGSGIVRLFDPKRYEVKKSIVEFPAALRTEAKRILDGAGVRYRMEDNNGSVMAMPPNTSKVRGLGWLLARTGASFRDVIAFGNGENDIGFMKKSRISVAVANAAQAVKDAADYVASESYGEGIISFLEGAVRNE